jgi:uncharacterized coiled-coil protein SlyX
MNKNDLMELGIAEDVAEKVIVLHGKNIEKHKSLVEQAEAKQKELEEKIAEQTGKIEDLSKTDVGAYQTQIDEWKTRATTLEEDLKKAQEEAQKTVAEVKRESLIDNHLLSAKARNLTATKALLKMDGITMTETGELDGFTEQFDTLKSEHGYLFEESEAPPANPRIVTGSRNEGPAPDSMVEAARTAANLK